MVNPQAVMCTQAKGNMSISLLQPADVIVTVMPILMPGKTAPLCHPSRVFSLANDTTSQPLNSAVELHFADVPAGKSLDFTVFPTITQGMSCPEGSLGLQYKITGREKGSFKQLMYKQNVSVNSQQYSFTAPPFTSGLNVSTPYRQFMHICPPLVHTAKPTFVRVIFHAKGLKTSEARIIFTEGIPYQSFWVTPLQPGHSTLGYKLELGPPVGAVPAYAKNPPKNSTIQSKSYVWQPNFTCGTLIAGVPCPTTITIRDLPPESIALSLHSSGKGKVGFEPEKLTFQRGSKKQLSFKTTVHDLSDPQEAGAISISYTLSGPDTEFYVPAPPAKIHSLGQLQLPSRVVFDKGHASMQLPKIQLTAEPMEEFDIGVQLPKGLTSNTGKVQAHPTSTSVALPKISATAAGNYTIKFSLPTSYGKDHYQFQHASCEVVVPGPIDPNTPTPAPTPPPTSSPPTPVPAKPTPPPTKGSGAKHERHDLQMVGFVTIPVALIAVAIAVVALLRARRARDGAGERQGLTFPLWDPRSKDGGDGGGAASQRRGSGRHVRRKSGSGASAGGGDGDEEGGSRQALLGKAAGFDEEEAQTWLVDLDQLEIFEEIGGGASAQVYRGAYFGQTVAIKRLYAGQALETQDKFVEFFGNEARLLATLHHPHVVRFFGAAYEPQEKRGLLVTELCAKGSLSAHLAMRSPRSPEVSRDRFFDLSLGISRALQFFHARQFVHRDLKPDNVLLDEKGVAKLCDFGLSRVIDSSTQANTMTAGVGTPAFMAIELIVGDMSPSTPSWGQGRGAKAQTKAQPGGRVGQLSNRSPSLQSEDDVSVNVSGAARPAGDGLGGINIDASSHAGTKVDVFSFGVMLWVLWTQSMPYLDLKLTPFTLMNKVVGGLRPELPDDSPRRLAQLMERCWAHNPADRPAFSEITTELEAIEVAPVDGEDADGCSV
eukprot:g773.t1